MNDQLDLLDMVRASDPETSHAAARITNRALGMRRVLRFLVANRSRSFTDHEIAEATGMNKGSASKRRLDCQRKGWVEFAGVWGVSPDGCPARKWKPTDTASEGLT